MSRKGYLWSVFLWSAFLAWMVWWIPDITAESYFHRFFCRRSFAILVLGAWGILLWEATVWISAGRPWRFVVRTLPFLVLPWMAVQLTGNIGYDQRQSIGEASGGMAMLWFAVLAAFAFAAGNAALAAAKSAARKEPGEGLSGKKGRAAFAWSTGLFTAVLVVAGVCVGQSDPASRVILKEGVAIPGRPDKVLPTLTFSEPLRAYSAEYRLQMPGQTATPVWRCSFPVPGLYDVGPTSIESRTPYCHAAFLQNMGGRTGHSGHAWLSLDLAIPNSQRGDWWTPDRTDRTGPSGPIVRIKGDLILHNATVIQRDVTTFMQGAEAIVSWPGQEMRITRDGQVRSRIWAPPPFLGGTDSIFRNNYMLWNGSWICEFSLYPEDGPRPFFRDYRQHPRKPTFKPYGPLPPNTPTFKPHCQLPSGAILVNEQGIELPSQKFAPEDLKFSGSISLCAPLDPVVWHLDFELLLPPPSTPP